MSVADVADKIRQIRRRFVWRIQIYFVNGVRVAAIQIRDDAINPPRPLGEAEYRTTPIPQYVAVGTETANTSYGVGCWATYAYVPFTSDADLETIYQRLKEAIKAYYEINPDYTITPWTVGNWDEKGEVV